MSETGGPTPLARLAGLSVVVPALDEVADIRRVVGALLAGLPRVRVLRHATDQGYGAALRTGFDAARAPWIFLTDGDGQFDARELARLVAAAPGADVVAGYRRPRADSAVRCFAGAVWSRLVRLLLGVRVGDVNCAFKLVRRDVLDAVALASRGALVNAELLGKAVRRGFRVVEVPVSHRPRLHGRATGGSWRVAWRALAELRALAHEIRAPAGPGVVARAAPGLELHRVAR